MGIKVSSLVEDFEQALSWSCPYFSPGFTSWSRIRDGVDCSGLFVAAFERHGGSIYHGSNTIARKHVTGLAELKKESQLFRGAVVFKWLDDGGEPQKYRNDGLGDFVHIGLCVSVSPLKIIHASSAAGCVTSDSRIGKWKYFAKLNGVDYETTETKEEKEVVSMLGGVLRTNVTINIRQGKGTGYAKLGKVPSGVELNFEGDVADKWVRIQYGNANGYICTTNNYVTVISSYDKTPTEETNNDSDSAVQRQDALYRDELETRVSDLEEGSAAQTAINEAFRDIIRELCKREGIDVPDIPHMINTPIDTFEADE